MSELICPICQTESKAIYGEGAKPEPHRITWCLSCCSVLEFDEGMQLIPVTAETLEQADLLELSRMNNEVRHIHEQMELSAKGEVILDGVAEAEKHMKSGGIWVAQSAMDIVAFLQNSDLPIEVYSNDDKNEFEVICSEYYSGEEFGGEQ